MKLIDNPREVWRHFSTWALLGATLLQGGWLLMPEVLRADLPAHTGQWIEWAVLFITTWGAGGKFVEQPGVKS